MNRTKISLIIIAVVLIVIIAGAFVAGKNNAKAPVGTNTNSSTSSTVASVTASGTSSGLAVSTSTATAYTGPDFSFIYPKPWKYIPSADFSIDTFGGNYENGGIIPAEGAEVDVVTTTISGPVDDIVNTEVMGAMNIVTSTMVVDKVTCEKATGESNYAPGYTSSDIDVYCARGSKLWKMYLSYNENDPAGKTHVSDFTGMLTSMKFLP